jgi:hypothetical protein
LTIEKERFTAPRTEGAEDKKEKLKAVVKNKEK